MKAILENKTQLVFILILITSVFYGCEKEYPYKKSANAINTLLISNVLQTSATVSGIVNTDNGSYIYERGICFDTNDNPTIENSKQADSNPQTGNFSCFLLYLKAGTTYYARAYATNSYGTAYGNVVSFTTKEATLPVISSTTSAYSITQSSATSGGTITSDGAANITGRGVCWSNTTSNPTIVNNKTNDGIGTGAFTSYLTGLTPNTTYYLRAYATNSKGTVYGDAKIFSTQSAASFAIGQSYQGGVIAYIFQPGESGYVNGQTHGLIATTSNQSTGYPWGCQGITIGTSTIIGSGQNNTTSIINGCSTASSAAYLCNNLTSGGYSDWYLPSKDELYKLYLNRATIGGFSNAYYFSSSEYSSIYAWVIDFSTGSTNNVAGKSSFSYVRAIRKF